MPAFSVQPKRSPLGRSSRSAGSSGRAPAGPGWAVTTVSRTERSDSQVRRASAGNEDIWSHYRLPMLMRWPARWRRPVRFVSDVGDPRAPRLRWAPSPTSTPTRSTWSSGRRRTAPWWPRASASRPSGSSSPASAAWPPRPGASGRRAPRPRRPAPATGSSSCTATRRRSARARTCAATISCGSSASTCWRSSTPASATSAARRARPACTRPRAPPTITCAASTASPPSRIAIYGWSLGTGAAVPLARDVDEAALIVEGGFTSVLARAGEQHPFMPVRWLLHTLQVRRGDRRHAQRDALPAQPGRHDHPLPARRGDVRQGRRAEAPGAPRRRPHLPERRGRRSLQRGHPRLPERGRPLAGGDAAAFGRRRGGRGPRPRRRRGGARGLADGRGRRRAALEPGRVRAAVRRPAVHAHRSPRRGGRRCSAPTATASRIRRWPGTSWAGPWPPPASATTRGARCSARSRSSRPSSTRATRSSPASTEAARAHARRGPHQLSCLP